MKENSYSKERKELQEQGLVPQWMSTGSWQIYKSKYLYKANNVKEQYQRIAKTAAKHVKNYYPEWWNAHYEGMSWEDVFFKVLWDGDLSPSSPVHSNMGTDRGSPVSCSGSYVEDSISGFYKSRLEIAMLTKEGFGTSAYLGDIRPRGAMIQNDPNFKASGVKPVLEMFVDDMEKICQGSSRRGAFAGYLEIDHGDAQEICEYIQEEQDGINVGWLVSEEFIQKIRAGCRESLAAFNRTMKVRMATGKGYYTFPDKVNTARPEAYVKNDLYFKAAQLCNEISLFSDKDHSYSCVLSSLNLSNYRAWNPKLAFIATVFLDCVCEEFLIRARKIPELVKVVRATEKGRALGLGVMGLATLFQKEGLPFEGFEAHMLNNRIFSDMKDESEEASRWMANVLGESEWCKGLGIRNTHLRAIAPTKSTGLIMGGVSEGINPDVAMTYTQTTAAGEVDRINPILLQLMKDKGVYSKKHLQEVIDAEGSVQGVDWLTEEEKKVFKTAFEMDMKNILRLASVRQTHLDQMQSLNLFFSSDESESYIGEVHAEAFLDPNIHSLYYCYSKRGVAASKDSCEACQ